MKKIGLLILLGISCCSKKKYELIHGEREATIQLSGFTQLVACFRKQKRKISAEEKFLNAIKKGNIRKVKSLLSQGVSIDIRDEYGNTPLHVATRYDLLAVLKYLLGDGNKIESDRMGLQDSHQDLSAPLLGGEGVKLNINPVDNFGWTPLHWAAYHGYRQTLAYLKERGADIHREDNAGWVPLHRAVQGGHLEVIVDLLNAGAAIDAKDKSGATPLHLAATKDCLKVLKVLLERGANIHVKDIDDWHPLHLAAAQGCQKAVEILIEKGADIEAATKDGSTPLHWAVMKGYKNIAVYLIGQGAAINAIDKDGYTPASWASVNSDWSGVLK